MMAPLGNTVMKRSLVTCAAVLMALVAGTVAAHHAPILFDRTKKVALSGTVAEFAWMNPHASIQIDVTSPEEFKGRWGVEMNSPNNLVKDGWKSTLLKTGDKVTVVVNPLRTGEHGGIFVSIKLTDGRVLGDKWTD